MYMHVYTKHTSCMISAAGSLGPQCLFTDSEGLGQIIAKKEVIITFISSHLLHLCISAYINFVVLHYPVQ